MEPGVSADAPAAARGSATLSWAASSSRSGVLGNVRARVSPRSDSSGTSSPLNVSVEDADVATCVMGRAVCEPMNASRAARLASSAAASTSNTRRRFIAVGSSVRVERCELISIVDAWTRERTRATCGWSFAREIARRCDSRQRYLRREPDRSGFRGPFADREERRHRGDEQHEHDEEEDLHVDNDNLVDVERSVTNALRRSSDRPPRLDHGPRAASLNALRVTRANGPR